MFKGKLFGGNPTTATRPRKTRDSANQTGHLFRVPGRAGATLILCMKGCLLAVICVIETAARRTARARLALEDDPAPVPPVPPDAV
jgi:hypothetical protein